MELSVDQLNRKLDSMKIDAHRKVCETLEVPANKDVPNRLDQHMHPSPTCESFNSGGSISSSEAIGDAASSYGSREEYSELAFVAAPNGFISPNGTIYAGSPAPFMNMPGYLPYPMEGVHYQTPVIDYSCVNQPYCGSLSPGMQYPTHANSGYAYGPQVYQYPPQPFHQQVPSGQYFSAPPGLPAGGVMMLDSQDPSRSGVVMSSGFTNITAYAGPMTGFPVAMVPPPLPCEKGAIPVAVTYPPSHTLRASAPAWIESSVKPKGSQSQGNYVANQTGAPPVSAANFAQPSKSLSLNHPTVSTIVSKSSAPPTVVVATTASQSSSGISVVDSKVNGCLEGEVKQQGKGSGIVHNQSSSLDVYYEQNKDAWVSKVKGSQLAPVLKPPKGTLNKDVGTCLPNGEQCNSPDFVIKYDDAKHFIIKSYSEDNVHKSIQYAVWASTPNGNKKLDGAYQDAQRRAGGKPRGCPVFLYFSVNGSRQFCGVAEMTGPVDYSRTMEFWEQHKWSGSFPIKWHIIKDVPNSQLRRIILENNENKPVTNSRDTQEVNFSQGLEMLSIFKSYPARTSILDELPTYHGPSLVKDVNVQPWSPQCFPKIGEQIAKERDEVNILKTAKPSATLKISENGPRLKDSQGKIDSKPALGKALEPSAQDSRVEK